MTTPQTHPTRTIEFDEAIRTLKDANALSLVPGVFTRAAIRIGQHGWWSGSRPSRQGKCYCIWLAVETEMDDSFGNPNTPLRGQAFTVVIGLLVNHFNVKHLRDVFNLNDKQPEHEGQAWAIYHLNAIADQVKTEYGL